MGSFTMLGGLRLAYRPDFDISHKLSQLESAYERLKPRMMTMDKKRKELEVIIITGVLDDSNNLECKGNT